MEKQLKKGDIPCMSRLNNPLWSFFVMSFASCVAIVAWRRAAGVSHGGHVLMCCGGGVVVVERGGGSG
jgi:hypothetical protein